MRWLVLLAALLLSGCGGGGGHSNPPPVQPIPRHELLYCYFGITKREEIAEFVDHCNAVWIMDWCNWDDPKDRERWTQFVIDCLQDAKARGIDKAILAVGYLTFTSTYQFHGAAAVATLRTLLDELGLREMVVGLSLIDEPDLHDVPDEVMARAFAETKAAWPEAKMTVIYGDHGTPGISHAEWIGHDAYGLGDGVLNRMPGLQGAQRWLLVPGGADPWKNSPEPFLDFARTHAEVAGIVPFTWFDRAPGQDSGPGIRSNGMSGRYRAIGLQIKGGNG